MDEKISGQAYTSREALWRELIGRVDGVRSTCVIFSEDGSAQSIAVVADERKGPKQIIRDIQTVLSTTFELEIDASIVHVGFASDQPASPRASRICFSGMDLHVSAAETTVAVHLAYSGQEYSGHGILRQSLSRRRMVAEATIDALHRFLEKIAFELADVVIECIAGHQVVVTVIHCLGNDQWLAGSAIMGGDVDSATIKSVLDAINRQVDVLKC